MPSGQCRSLISCTTGSRAHQERKHLRWVVPECFQILEPSSLAHLVGDHEHKEVAGSGKGQVLNVWWVTARRSMELEQPWVGQAQGVDGLLGEPPLFPEVPNGRRDEHQRPLPRVR